VGAVAVFSLVIGCKTPPSSASFVDAAGPSHDASDVLVGDASPTETGDSPADAEVFDSAFGPNPVVAR